MALEQQDDFVPIPKPEFDVRTGKPLAGVSNEEKSTQQPGTKRRGIFLRNRLTKLYNDPTYKGADPSLQLFYKEKAYDKWVVPYYKHINETPMTKEEFLSGRKAPKGWVERANESAQAAAVSVNKEGAKILGGLTGLLSHLAEGIDLMPTPQHFDLKGKTLKLQQFFKEREADFEEERRVLNGGQEPSWKHNPGQKLAEASTQAIFFEATGAAKAHSVLRIANPKTAELIFRMGKSAWNTGVGFGLWSASQGETPEEIVQSAGTGGVLGIAGVAGKAGVLKVPGVSKFVDMLKSLFKFGGNDAAKVVIGDGIHKASAGHGADPEFEKMKDLLVKEFGASRGNPDTLKDQIEKLLKEVKPLEEAYKKKKTPYAEVISTSPLTPESKIASSAVAIRLQNISKNKYNKSFDKLPWIQQRAVINIFLSKDAMAAKMAANSEPMSAEVLHVMMKEQQAKLGEVAPKAQQVEKKVDGFVKQNGKDYKATKLHATMPHHDTTVDSSWQQLQARASFLKSRLRIAKTAEEKQAIKDALNDEYKLMKDKGNKEKIGKQLLSTQEEQMLSSFEHSQKQRVESFKKLKGKASSNIPLYDPKEIRPAFEAYKQGKASAQQIQLLDHLGSNVRNFLDTGKSLTIEQAFGIKSKPGAAVIGDPNAFKGEDFLVRPAERSDAAVFDTWRQDKMAGAIFNEVVKTSPIGALDPKAQAILTSIQGGNSLAQFTSTSFQENIVLHHTKFGPIGGANFSIIGEGGDKTLMLNWIALRPNVVARVYDVPGAGENLFLNILERAKAANAGVELHSAPSARKFYSKMGMIEKEDTGNFSFSAEQVRSLLKEKGLLMGLIGAGIGTWAASPDQVNNDITASPRDSK